MNNFYYRSVTAVCCMTLAFSCFTLKADAPAGKMQKDLEYAKKLVTTEPQKDAFDIFAQYAKNGDPEAMAWLARSYLNGLGTEKDYKKAFEYFKQAAQQGHPRGLNGLGLCYMWGRGCDVNYKEALRCLSEADKKGFYLAAVNLGLFYGNRKNGFYNLELAEKYYKKAIAQKVPDAKYLYALFLYDNSRYKEAVALLQTLTDNHSKMLLAKCYSDGRGCDTDSAKAAQLLKQIPHNEWDDWCGEFFFAYGHEFYHEKPESQTYVSYFELAAEAGNKDAQFALAKLKEKTSPKNAISYYHKAINGGDTLAMLELAQLYESQKEYDEAYEYYVKTSLNDNPRLKELAFAGMSRMMRLHLNQKKQAYFVDQHGSSLHFTQSVLEVARYLVATKKPENIVKGAALLLPSHVMNETVYNEFFNFINNHYDVFQAQADNDNPDALLALGFIGFIEGKEHPNFPVGVELLNRAAKLKNGAACWLFGLIAPADSKERMEWYRKGAEYGHCDTARLYALRCFDHVKKQTATFDTCKKAFERCLELGIYDITDEYAAFLADYAKDKKRADDILMIGLKHGIVEAILKLYKNAMAEKDFTLAQALLEHGASTLVEPDLMVEYGIFAKDIMDEPRKAFMWFQLAANTDSSHKRAFAKLAECWLNGYGCTKNIRLFWKVAEIAEKNKSPEIYSILGNVYRDGVIGSRNLKKAEEYYSVGAELGDEECRKALQTLKK